MVRVGEGCRRHEPFAERPRWRVAQGSDRRSGEHGLLVRSTNPRSSTARHWGLRRAGRPNRCVTWRTETWYAWTRSRPVIRYPVRFSRLPDGTRGGGRVAPKAFAPLDLERRCAGGLCSRDGLVLGPFAQRPQEICRTILDRCTKKPQRRFLSLCKPGGRRAGGQVHARELGRTASR